MTPSSEPTPFLLYIVILIFLPLLTGLILSVSIFFTKNKAAEAFAWLCASLWFIFDQLLVSRGFFAQLRSTNFLIFPVLLIFYLLLQFRSNISAGKALKIYSVVKSCVLVTIVSQFLIQLTGFIFKTAHLSTITALDAFSIYTSVICSFLILLLYVLISLRYLRQIKSATKPVFKNVAVYFSLVYAGVVLIGFISHSILYLLCDQEHFRYADADYFSWGTVLSTLEFFFFYLCVTTFTSGYLYRIKIKAKMA